MDLPTIRHVHRPRRFDEVPAWTPATAWLAGGTWLFSDPQPHLDTLVDLETLAWPPLTASDAGLEIAATCKIAALDQFVAPPDWIAAPLIQRCCRSFLASFKIWNEATVGGNLVMSLPAGPIISLAAALEGTVVLWPRDGAPREMRVVDFVLGDQRNALAPGELLRSVHLPAHALRRRTAFRRFSLTHLGRSEVLLIGTRDPAAGEFRLTVTAATPRPVQLVFPAVPTASELTTALNESITEYFDDAHGSPAHRRHLTHYFAEQIRAELAT